VKHSFITTLKRWLELNSGTAQKQQAKEDNHPHVHMTERQIDKTLADSFPASDPPPWH
jgi:hypothetical protein